MWNTPEDSKIVAFLSLFVSQRFFPIFSLLFGIGFGLMFRSALTKTMHPHRVMLRRIGVLGVMGVIHGFFHAGEALLPYAICALCFLLPVSFLPPQWQRGVSLIGGVLLILGGGYFGGVVVIPGLFLSGYYIAHAGVLDKLEHAQATIWLPTIILILLSAGAVFLQAKLPDEESMGPVPSYAGLVMAATYIFITVALMTTPVRGCLTAFFSPLGRMALTNYLSAVGLFTTVRAS